MCSFHMIHIAKKGAEIVLDYSCIGNAYFFKWLHTIEKYILQYVIKYKMLEVFEMCIRNTAHPWCRWIFA